MAFRKLGMIEVLLVFNSTPLLFEHYFIEVGSVCRKHERAKAFALRKRGDNLREL